MAENLLTDAFWGAVYFISAIFWAKNSQKSHKANRSNEIISQKIALDKYLANAKFG